jgi:hypothetical protein
LRRASHGTTVNSSRDVAIRRSRQIAVLGDRHANRTWELI